MPNGIKTGKLLYNKFKTGMGYPMEGGLKKG
jgi:hypothetical protein